MTRDVALVLMLLAAPAALAQEADVAKAVQCQTLNQQFGDSLAAAKVDDAVKKAAAEQRAAGVKACIDKSYDQGIEEIRAALVQIGKTPIR